jgi:prevent-host-death family protein
MEEIAISKFKATCLSVLENVRKTGKTVLVTRFGEPVAEVVPPHASKKTKNGSGPWRGRVR